MKTMQSTRTDSTDEIYNLVEDLFGSMRADAEYFNITHPQY